MKSALDTISTAAAEATERCGRGLNADPFVWEVFARLLTAAIEARDREHEAVATCDPVSDHAAIALAGYEMGRAAPAVVPADAEGPWICAECGERNPPTSGKCSACGYVIGPVATPKTAVVPAETPPALEPSNAIDWGLPGSERVSLTIVGRSEADLLAGARQFIDSAPATPAVKPQRGLRRGTKQRLTEKEVREIAEGPATPPTPAQPGPNPCGHSDREHEEGLGGQSCAVLAAAPQAQKDGTDAK